MYNKNNPEYFIIDLNSDLAAEKMKETIGPSFVIENFLPQEKIEKLKTAAFSTQPDVIVTPHGNILTRGALSEIFELVREETEKILGPIDCPAIGGHFFAMQTGVKLHNDGTHRMDFLKSIEEFGNHPDRKYVPWKNLVIPLWFNTQEENDFAGYITFFNERACNWGHIYGNKTVFYVSDIDQTNIKYFNEHGEFVEPSPDRINLDLFEKYLDEPYDRVGSYTVENIFEWKPNNALFFDATQLHTSSPPKEEPNRFFNLKLNVLFTFYRAID